MIDRELLERAAKAAGLRLTWGDKYRVGDDEIDCTDVPYALSNSPDESPFYWNPLTDDGDALRLAVRLSLDIFTNDGDGGHTSVGGGTDVFVQETHGTDPLAATRRAIVRAAAALADTEPT